MSVPVPWRELAHLQRHQSRAPVFLVSAYIDTRPLYGDTSASLILVLVLAVAKQYQLSGLLCVTNAALTEGTGSTRAPLTVRAKIKNTLTHLFDYEATTATCPFPAATPLAPSASLWVTVVQDDASRPANSTRPAASISHDAWVKATWIPFLNATQQADYAQGNGPVAVCAPPLHTDAHAASMVSWAEFQRTVGASRVFVYSFNPGPFVRPILLHYRAAGFFQLLEWIIPTSILRDPDQPCLLPYFHPSTARQRFHSPACTYHQDNYNIGWWGQVLAIQDCVHRAMGRYRWVAVIDYDEYLVPRALHAPTPQPPPAGASTPAAAAARPRGPTLTKLLAHLATSGTSGAFASEYVFRGMRLCPGCGPHRNLSHPEPRARNASEAAPLLHVATPPLDGIPAVALAPAAGFDSLLWDVVVCSGQADHSKAVVDPLVFEATAIHFTAQFHDSGALFHRPGPAEAVPFQLAAKHHSRVHEIHDAAPSFAAKMLPLLKRMTRAGALDPHLAGFPFDSTCGACAADSAPSLDYTLPNLFGHQLRNNVQRAVLAMRRSGVFRAWLQLNDTAANVYGGYSFSAWAPP